MFKIKLIYSVNDGGDGSAYPKLYDSIELADWDQDRQHKEFESGFAECCTGSFTVESESPIKILDNVNTVESELEEIQRRISECDHYKDKDSYYKENYNRLMEMYFNFIKDLVEIRDKNQK